MVVHHLKFQKHKLVDIMKNGEYPLLEQELRDLGLEDVNLDQFGYLVGRIPPRGKPNLPCLGFLAHVDTASDVSGKDATPPLIVW